MIYAKGEDGIKKDMKKNKEKKQEREPLFITMWAIIDTDYPETPVSFTATREDAQIALDQYIYLKHYTHFRLWCENHNLKVDHNENWRNYIHTVMQNEVSQEDLADPSKAPYRLEKISYPANVIASLLRSYNHCAPLGCPFDTEEELADYSYYISDKTEKVRRGEDEFTPLEKSLNAIWEDLDQEELEDDCPDIDCDHKSTSPMGKIDA